MTVRKQRELDKKNQKILAKSFLTLLCKEKLFRETKAITKMSLKKYNSQYRFNLFYDDHDDWIHGFSYRVTVFFKASKEIEIRIRGVGHNHKNKKKIKYPNDVLNSVSADDVCRKIIKQYEKLFDKGAPWLKERFTPLRIGENDIAFYKYYIKDLKNWFFVDNSIIREIEYINRDKDKKLAKVKFKTDENIMIVAESPIRNKICFYKTMRMINEKYLELESALLDEEKKLLKDNNKIDASEFEKRFERIVEMHEILESCYLYYFSNNKINEFVLLNNLFNNKTKVRKENYNLFKNSESYNFVKNFAVNSLK